MKAMGLGHGSFLCRALGVVDQLQTLSDAGQAGADFADAGQERIDVGRVVSKAVIRPDHVLWRVPA